jgi:hypothetical protein
MHHALTVKSGHGAQTSVDNAARGVLEHRALEDKAFVDIATERKREDDDAVRGHVEDISGPQDVVRHLLAKDEAFVFDRLRRIRGQLDALQRNLRTHVWIVRLKNNRATSLEKHAAHQVGTQEVGMFHRQRLTRLKQ